MTVSHPLMFATRTVSHAQLRAMLAPAPSMADWARAVLPAPLQQYQLDLLTRMDQVTAAGQLHILPGRHGNLRRAVAMLRAYKGGGDTTRMLLDSYLMAYGEPWAKPEQHPATCPNTIIRALRALYRPKRESV